MARSIIIPLIALVLSCGVLINGCLNHSRLPSEGEERLIQQHSGVIVLLRLRTVVEGKPTGRHNTAGKKSKFIVMDLVSISGNSIPANLLI